MKRYVMMLSIVGVLVSAGLSGSVVFAQQDTHREAAEAFLLAMDTPKQLSEGITTMVDMMIQAQPMMAPYRATIRSFYQKYLSWDALKNEYIMVAKNLLTEKELRDVTAFFRTESGRAFIAKQPEMFQQTSEMGFRIMQENQQELMDILEAEAQKY